MKSPLVQTLINIDAPVEFSNQDWQIMDKIIEVLRPFKEATEMLSHRDACISMTIPIVTAIMKSLDTSSADQGVKTMKKDLKESMDRRFVDIEDKFYYSAATLLDAKFKKNLFRDPFSIERTKNMLLDKMVQSLQRESQVSGALFTHKIFHCRQSRLKCNRLCLQI